MAKKAAQQASDAASGAVDPDIAALSYEDGIAELERLVEGIESNDIGLEASLAAYRRGQQLVQHCRGLLDKAELSVKQLSLADAEQGG
jgi:exodeoxyribonuclease VII small subunit